MDSGWLRLQFRVDASYFDELASLLEVCLALSVSIENDGEDEFFEVAFPERPTWKRILVSALFHDTVDSQAIIDFINSTLFKTTPVPVLVEKMQDQDWVRVWLDQFQPIHIAHDLWIVPSWLDAPKPQANNLCIDPGLAFGTGTHATTFLCLEYIAENDFTGKTVLDFGAGSGILAIASLLQGAEQATAVDIDPLAVKACQDNGEYNQVAENLLSLHTNDFLNRQSRQRYSVVIANILAEVLIEHAEMLLTYTRQEGTLLLSGILANQQHGIESAFSKYANCTFTKIERDGWLLIKVQKYSL